MKQLVVVRNGSLSSKDKQRLTKSGFVWLEVEDPADVRLLVPTSDLVDPNDILMAAMEGACDGINSKDVFATELHRRLLQREKKK